MNEMQEYPHSLPDKVFREIRKAAIGIWKDYDDTHGYASAKIKRVKGYQNIEGEWSFIVGMFDPSNQKKLIQRLDGDARAAVVKGLYL